LLRCTRSQSTRTGDRSGTLERHLNHRVGALDFDTPAQIEAGLRLALDLAG